jgi:hypothetical protein
MRTIDQCITDFYLAAGKPKNFGINSNRQVLFMDWRHMLRYFLKTRGFSLRVIASVTNCKSHATILNSCRKVEDLKDLSNRVRLIINSIPKDTNRCHDARLKDHNNAILARLDRLERGEIQVPEFVTGMRTDISTLLEHYEDRVVSK